LVCTKYRHHHHTLALLQQRHSLLHFIFCTFYFSLAHFLSSMHQLYFPPFAQLCSICYDSFIINHSSSTSSHSLIGFTTTIPIQYSIQVTLLVSVCMIQWYVDLYEVAAHSFLISADNCSPFFSFDYHIIGFCTFCAPTLYLLTDLSFSFYIAIHSFSELSLVVRWF